MSGGNDIGWKMVIPKIKQNCQRDLVKRFGSPYCARKARAQLMHIQQGIPKLREYTAEFQNLLDKLPHYDESWMAYIFFLGITHSIGQICECLWASKGYQSNKNPRKD